MKSGFDLHKELWINGKIISYREILSSNNAKTSRIDNFEREIFLLIKKWESGQKSFNLRSSGSTGKSKIIKTSREKLTASAKLTLKTLGLTKGINAVLCLPPEYTAGKLFIIRALIGKFNLYAITPSSNPLISLPAGIKIGFISLVPNQLYEILLNNTYNKWFDIKSTILVGGAPLSAELESKLKYLKGNLYHTFAMTETLSHIALRKLNGKRKSESYETLENITVSVDKNNCLIIHAPHLSSHEIQTHDQVQLLDSRHFIWKGRLDHVIITGGIKIIVENLESEIEKLFLQNTIHCNIMVTATSDPKFGEKIILLVEDKNKSLKKDQIKKILLAGLKKHEIPREIDFLEEFIYTDNYKIDRRKTKNAVL